MSRCCVDCGTSSEDQELQPEYLFSNRVEARASSRFVVDEPSLAQELNALTVEEREKVYEEIHGVVDVVEETPELVADSLQKMRDELAKVSKRKRVSFDRAIFLKPSIATDDTFHLMFLRAERFDPEKAAVKMYRYFDHKLQLFGDEKLVKRITLDDLGEAEMKCMYEGWMQVLKVNDKGLRALYSSVSVISGVDDWKSFTRYIWYQLMSALEHEETQKRGIVEIANMCTPWQISAGSLLNALRKSHHILNDRPVRICAYHLLYDQPSIFPFITGMNSMMKKDLRLRNKFHFGSSLEIKYNLLTFGIVLSDDFFQSGQGIFATDHAEAYLQERRRKEAELERLDNLSLSGGCCLFPSPKDVLMGRGRPFQSWYGNIALLSIVQEYTTIYYVQVDRHDKTEIASSIVRRIQEEGGRFLQRTDRHWEAVEDIVARNKVSQVMRAILRSRQSGGDTIFYEDPAPEEESSLERDAGNSSKKLVSSAGEPSSKRHRLH